MTVNIAQIAAKLTEAERKALLGAVQVKIAPYPQRWEVRQPRIWRQLVKKGLGFAASPLMTWRNGVHDRCVLNDLGVAVRKYLKHLKQQEGIMQ